MNYSTKSYINKSLNQRQHLKSHSNNTTAKTTTNTPSNQRSQKHLAIKEILEIKKSHTTHTATPVSSSSSTTIKHFNNNNDDERHFIFGYGSLICSQSRSITAPSLSHKEAHPVIVEHLVRTWSARCMTRMKQQHDTTATTPNMITRTKASKQIHVSKHYDTTTLRQQQQEKKYKQEQEEQLNQLISISNEVDIQGQTAMGVKYAPNQKCCGVLIEVDTVELELFDQREKGYDRVEIDLAHIWNLHNDDDDINEGYKYNENDHIVLKHAKQKRLSLSLQSQSNNDINLYNNTVGSNITTTNTTSSSSSAVSSTKVWVYIQRNSIPANEKFPIVQSYVDIILRGCFRISPEFAKKFIETTHGWWSHTTIANDVHPNRGVAGSENGQVVPHTGDDDCVHDANKMEEECQRDEPKVEPLQADTGTKFVWIEDRHFPLYVRADPVYSKDMAEMIDTFLLQHHPTAMEKRKVLPVVSNLLPVIEKDSSEFD